jgi:hypothetical protein
MEDHGTAEPQLRAVLVEALEDMTKHALELVPHRGIVVAVLDMDLLAEIWAADLETLYITAAAAALVQLEVMGLVLALQVMVE